MKYPVQLHLGTLGQWIATFPDFPTVRAESIDLQHARELAKDLLIEFIVDQIENHRPLPAPSTCRLGQEMISLPKSISLLIKAFQSNKNHSLSL